MKNTSMPKEKLMASLRFVIVHCLTLSCLAFSSAPIHAAAMFKLTFTGTWNNNDVLGSIPSSAHFTNLFGATHKNGQAFWVPDTMADIATENVAEIGNVSLLSTEIESAIEAGTTKTKFLSASLQNFPASTSLTFETSDTHAFLSAISMIAPSPDWFVGVSNLALKQDGQWISDQTIALVPWDAGTEDGSQFSLSNADSSPHTPISILSNSPFKSTPVIASLRIELVSTPEPLTVKNPLPTNSGSLMILLD